MVEATAVSHKAAKVHYANASTAVAATAAVSLTLDSGVLNWIASMCSRATAFAGALRNTERLQW